jgi:hypothetical protein
MINNTDMMCNIDIVRLNFFKKLIDNCIFYVDKDEEVRKYLDDLLENDECVEF